MPLLHVCRLWGGRDNAQENNMTSLLKQFVGDESGATAIEYGLIAAGISIAIIVVVQGVGTKLNSTFTQVKDALQ
jgi:pilus assembly protein Flp/PilA